MANSSIVKSYPALQPGRSETLTLDDRIQNSIAQNGVRRPKGYTVSYHHNPELESMHFGRRHPMKPWRLTLTNKIVMAYGMHEAMDVYIPTPATEKELTLFHKEDYVDFLRRIRPEDDTRIPGSQGHLYGTGEDCPIFDGLFDYCSLYTGASLDAARKLTNQQSDIAINWSGGLHHAKKTEASGFCYINDIVIAILQLLLHHPRVLYIDIDVHHGDGVEQAFWSTDRVMTISFHKYDPQNFFPGTGGMEETGPINTSSPGAHHSLNVPLKDGIENDQYVDLFKNTVGPCINKYNPTAIVIQCGADSLGGDRLGCFNLNIQAHGACVDFVKKSGLPLLVLGGGGYTPRNVAKAWAYETSVCLGADLDPDLPSHTPFLAHMGETTLLPHLENVKRFENLNSPEYLQELIVGVHEQLRFVEGNPSVQLQHIPPDLAGWRREAERQYMEEKYDEDQEQSRRERRG